MKLNGSAPKPAVNGLMLVCLVLNTLSELQKCGGGGEEKIMDTKVVCTLADQGKLQMPLLSLFTNLVQYILCHMGYLCIARFCKAA